MSIYTLQTLGETDNQIRFNDLTATPYFRVLARSANKFAIRQQDLPVPFESGSSDFLTLLGDSGYVIQGKMYPSDEPSYDAGLMTLRSVCSLTLNQADVLSTDGYIPYIWQDFFNQKQIFMKPLYVELTETTQQGFVQPFTIIAKIIDPVIYAADLSTASTAEGTPVLQQTITNLVTNPSIETGTTGWFGVIGPETLSQSTAQSFSGTHSLSVVTTGNNQSAAINVVGISGTTQYTASMYVFITNGNTFNLKVDEFNGASYLVTDSASFTGTGGWQRVTLTFTTQSTTNDVNVYAQVTSGGAQTYYCDAVMLQTGSSATTYFDGSLTDTVANTYAWSGTADASTSTNSVYQTGNATYPFNYPVLYGANTFSVSADCNNIGTLPVYPVTVTVNGPVTNPKVTNLATGEFIGINVTLNSPSDQLNITYNASSQDINLNGVNVAKDITTGSTLFKIHPGTNTIQLSGSSVGGGAVAEVQFYSGYPLS